MTRRRFVAPFICAVIASAVGNGLSGVGVGASPIQRVAMLNLTKNDRYDNVVVVNGRIVLYGRLPSSGICSSAAVDPSTLALSDARSGNCADPAASDRSVIPAISLDKDLPASTGGPSDVVRIAHVSAGSAGYTLGPIVMTFPYFAAGQTSPRWVYGGGDLFLYDWVNHFDLLRISATTGAVLQRLVVPKIRTPLLAFNNEGLWIAPTGESSGPLYRLAPGASDVSVVFHFGRGGFAWWMTASGHSVWLDAQPRPVSETSTVWELRGPDATPVWHVPANAVTNLHVGTVATEMVGDSAGGLWTSLVTPSQEQQRIVRLDPRTGKATVVATLDPGYSPALTLGPSSVLQSWKATTFDGSLFLLDPPAGVPGTADEVGGFSALYRITPAAS